MLHERLTSVLCVQVQHQDLKAAHEHLALTLEDHKSALAVAQVRERHRDTILLFATATEQNS